MRIALVLGGAALACTSTFGLVGLGTGSADAAPIPVLVTAKTTSAVETVGWRRRHWRRYGVWPTGPGPIAEGDAIVAMDNDDDIVIIAPVRPQSCGEYHYWDGTACLDARYNDPYLGPK